MNTTYKNFKVNQDDDQIVWAVMDREDMSVNSLNAPLIKELDQIIDEVSKSDAKALVIKSGKKNGFIAGADINQFVKLENKEQAFELVRQAQIVFDKLEAMKVPSIAMINGFCMGGGTELALACTYRIADEDKASIGLPEVKLGIHPGWGGSVRLPKLIGANTALQLICTGRPLRGKAAKKVGYVDEAVPARQLEHAVRFYALKQPKRKPLVWYKKIMNASLVRPIIAKLFMKELRKKVNEKHYPAPYLVVKNWLRDGCKGDKAMINEAKSIADMFVHPTSRNLVRIFFLQEKMKSLAKAFDFKAKHVHVIGAGTMGGDIAAFCALKGMRVTLQDREAQYIAPAMKRAHKLFKKKLKKPHLIQAALDRLMPDVTGSGVAKADVIIEAIFENLEAKQALFQSLEKEAKPSAVLASNTSSIPLKEIASAMKQPNRLVGIHFFNPVAMMQLVEVVESEETDRVVFDHAKAFVGQIGKLPLPVKSSPGFLVNRVLMPYLMECVTMIEEGIAPELIDKVATNFGMPMGPVELADTVGLDICYHVADILSQHLSGESNIPQRLKEMLDKKELGRKTGKGFYTYKKGKAIKAAVSSMKNADEIEQRLILRMVNESMACLREGVIAEKDLLDAGMIFGTGFAPFRGGPMNYAKTEGVDNIVSRLERLAEKHGDRFTPDKLFSS